MSQASLPRLEIVTLGPPRVTVGGADAPADVMWRKHLALLVYLALSPDGTRTRDHLVGLLWPEKTESKARHSLNEAVRRLRASLGADRLQSSGETLHLADADMTMDVIEFERACANHDPRALDYLRGEFFEGLTLDDSASFEGWLTAERERIGVRALQMLLERGEETLAALNYSDATEYARRALRLRLYSEPAVNLAMRALALSGDATEAVAMFGTFRDRLRADLGESPSKELEDLADRIRTRRWRGTPAKFADVEPPLMGRESAMQRAFALANEALGGEPRGLSLYADPGMGRTRLVAECAGAFSLRGGTVILARPLESDTDAPWSTLRALGRAGLADAPGAAGAGPEHRAVLAHLIPEIATVGDPTAPRDNAQVAAALADVMRAVADEQPLMIGIDDAHFADSPTLEALEGAVSLLDDTPVFLVITSLRDTQAAPKALITLRGSIGRAIPGLGLRLDALSGDLVQELVTALATWCEDEDERRRLARRITFDTGGSPFLAVTLLRGLEHAVTLREDIRSWPRRDETLESPLPISVPDLARMAIIASATALDEPAREVLAVASIVDFKIDTAFLAELMGNTADEISSLLATLERSHFLSFDGERYAFAAPLIAQVVRAELMTSGRRRALRERAITALDGRNDLESRLLKVQLQAEVAPTVETAQAATDVAREAQRTGANRTARRALRAADRALRTSPASARDSVERLREQLAHER